ncbi:hypothetical protein [Kitasatospora sp. NPDC001683]
MAAGRLRPGWRSWTSTPLPPSRLRPRPEVRRALLGASALGLAGAAAATPGAARAQAAPSGRPDGSDDGQRGDRGFRDKAVLITGATSGIGRAAALAFAAAGAG